MKNELLAHARELLPEAVDLRREIHRHPELGLELPRTRETVLQALGGLGLEIETSERTSAVVATLQGARPGRCLLLRGDMDALPMPEDTGLEYASREEGRMHACGHDAHTAMLALAARLLARERKRLPGTVKFFFQPGEEGFFGAKLALDEGLLERGRAPDACFAIHVDPRYPSGRIRVRPGPLLAAADFFELEIAGRGGHGSMPHDALDPIPVACEIVQALQTFVTRRIDVFDPVVLSVTKIEAGTTNNVIPETARLIGTVRSTSQRARERAHDGLRRIAERVAAAHELEARLELRPGYPVTENDAGFTDFTRRVLGEHLGPGALLDMPAPLMGAEDFSYLLQRWPGAMVFLGVSPRGEQPGEPNHSNRMRLDEQAMAHGIAAHAAMALEFLEAGQ